MRTFVINGKEYGFQVSLGYELFEERFNMDVDERFQKTRLINQMLACFYAADPDCGLTDMDIVNTFGNKISEFKRIADAFAEEYAKYAEINNVQTESDEGASSEEKKSSE